MTFDEAIALRRIIFDTTPDRKRTVVMLDGAWGHGWALTVRVAGERYVVSSAEAWEEVRTWVSSGTQ